MFQRSLPPVAAARASAARSRSSCSRLAACRSSSARVDAFLRGYPFIDVVVALPAELAANPPDYLDDVIVVEGGERRQDSVANAFRAWRRARRVVVIHDAARPLVTTSLIERTVDAAVEHGAAIAALQATDTVKRGDASRVIVGTLPRDEIFLAQTPQAFRVDVLRDALALAASAADATDEAMLAEQAGHVCAWSKATRATSRSRRPTISTMAERLLGARGSAPAMRIGNGYDLHRLVAGGR